VEGRLTEWNDERGFGFITPLGGGQRVFVHVSAFGRSGRRPQVDDLVHYETGLDDRGRSRAMVATCAGDYRAPVVSALPTPVRSLSTSAMISASFLVIVTALSLAGRIPMMLLGVYVALSVWLFMLYGIDKSAAQRHAWRAPESILHLGALLGGWPGALLAQSVFHHKTVKQPFRAIMWATVALNCLGLLATAAVWPSVPG